MGQTLSHGPTPGELLVGTAESLQNLRPLLGPRLFQLPVALQQQRPLVEACVPLRGSMDITPPCIPAGLRLWSGDRGRTAAPACAACAGVPPLLRAPPGVLPLAWACASGLLARWLGNFKKCALICKKTRPKKVRRMVRRHGTPRAAARGAGIRHALWCKVRRGGAETWYAVWCGAVQPAPVPVAAEIPELEADCAANSGISAANSVRAPAPRGVPN